jgi:pimeloyl-ACP methyl ester carboxylesterase
MGEGHPLVMILGLTATLDWWDPVMLEALSKEYRLLIFDNRGAGRTETPQDGEFTIEQFASDTAGLMDAVGFERAHVLGFSMGGMIAQGVALDFPEKIDKLILASTYCGGKTSVYMTRDVMATIADRSGTPREQVERFCSVLFCQEWLDAHGEDVEKFSERYLDAPATDLNAARQFIATVKFDACDRLPRIDRPTLVVAGLDDVLIPAENASIIAGRIPGAKLILYEDTGHGLVWERREEFLRELADFLG